MRRVDLSKTVKGKPVQGQSGPGGTGRPSYYSRPSADALEKARRTRNQRVGFFAVAAIAAVVFSAMWNPPTGSVHSFTAASDYNAEKESGCTNSGKGCHGSENSYQDFNDYHPEVECTSCHDYQGVGCIPCHAPKEHECQLCHDGTMPKAPDRTKITDPYPRGHYRETTHTAMGTDMKRTVRAAERGKARAACEDCHSRDLMASHTSVPAVAGSEYGDSVGCGECHNDVRAFGLAEVLSDWKDRSCERCHRVGSSAPMHDPEVATKVAATSEQGCGATGSGCHDQNDLHALHPDSPKRCSGSAEKGEPGCHDLDVESHKPTAKSCGDGDKSCHANYINDALSHARDGEVHSPSEAAANDRSFYDTPCGACHDMRADGRSLIAEHELDTSDGSDAGCAGCHNHAASLDAIALDWPNRNYSAGCADCHGTNGLDAAHAGDIIAKHEPAGSDGCASTGAGCHPTANLAEVGEPTAEANIHRDCLRCHDREAADGNVAFDPEKTTCGSGRDCHAGSGDYDPASSVHAGGSATVNGVDAAHTSGPALQLATLTDTASGVTATCSQCHASSLGAEHTRPSSALVAGPENACRGCHSRSLETGSVVKGDWKDRDTARACAACHSGSSVGAPHAQIDSAHAASEVSSDGTVVAGTCSQADCHSTADLRVLHKGSGCNTLGCHGSNGDIRGLAITSCGGTDPERTCHVGYSSLEGHAQVAASHNAVELDLAGKPSPGFCARSGCHTSASLKALHGTDGCAITGCHEVGLQPKLTSCGGTDATVGCHVGFSAEEHFADHSAHVSGTLNGVTYGEGENDGCLGCHAGDLVALHTGTDDGPITGGGASSCRVCHADYADPGNGEFAGLPDVRAAVAARDHRCTSCHRSGSSAPDDSSASSPHLDVSDADELAPGKVWADPLAQWKTALDSPVGGGHNVSWKDLGATPSFPTVTYDAGSTTYTWALPPNSGTTQWLKPEALGDGSPESTETITGTTVTCDDCHTGAEKMAGPHGSAVKIWIDPEYSQTEYANPTRGLKSQFDATGTDRVICMKCHNMNAGSVEGTSAPGGNPVHAAHAKHPQAPAHHPLRYGEKCIDCHVRIPHAWRSARLLVRTIESDGRPADTYPYVSRDHDGLAGVRLRSFTSPQDLRPDACATGGCHGYHSDKSHPEPSDIPTATYWP